MSTVNDLQDRIAGDIADAKAALADLAALQTDVVKLGTFVADASAAVNTIEKALPPADVVVSALPAALVV